MGRGRLELRVAKLQLPISRLSFSWYSLKVTQVFPLPLHSTSALQRHQRRSRTAALHHYTTTNNDNFQLNAARACSALGGRLPLWHFGLTRLRLRSECQKKSHPDNRPSRAQAPMLCIHARKFGPAPALKAAVGFAGVPESVKSSSASA